MTLALESRLTSIPQAIDALQALRAAPTRQIEQGWPLARVMRHCALSVRYSITGFPRLKASIIRATIGRLVASRFLKRGYMGHGLTAAIPGEPDFEEGLDETAAIDELLDTLRAFEAHDGALQPHFILGDLSKDQFAQMHAMHIADHLAVIVTR